MALWPDEHIEALREYMLEPGVPYSAVTAKLNHEFRTGYSRNAVIGKAGRLGIPSNNLKCGEKVIKSKAKPEPTVMVRKPPPPKPPTAPTYVLRCVEVEPLHISLIDLTDQTCKWPYGHNAPFEFCGHPAMFGPYCASHYHLAHRGGTS